MQRFYSVHKERIIEWIEKDLSPPNPKFNNLPRCPYAKKAVLDNKNLFTDVGIKDSYYKTVQKLVKEWDDSYDIAVINLDYKITPTAVSQLRMISNEGYGHKDFIFIEDFISNEKQNISIILMQRKSNIDKARAQLKQQGYYAGDPQD